MPAYSSLFISTFWLGSQSGKVKKRLKRAGMLYILKVLEKGMLGSRNRCYLARRWSMFNLGLKNSHVFFLYWW